MYKFSLLILTFLLFSCVKKQLKNTTIVIDTPIEQGTYHKNDTVFFTGTVSYEGEVKNVGLFLAMVNDANDSTFFQRTILPTTNKYSISEYYINKFNDGANVTVSYGKRNVKNSQIYELKTLKLNFQP